MKRYKLGDRVDPKIGEVFIYEGEKVITLKGEKCEKCAFYDNENIDRCCKFYNINCVGDDREDGTFVYFKKVK